MYTYTFAYRGKNDELYYKSVPCPTNDDDLAWQIAIELLPKSAHNIYIYSKEKI